MNLAEPQIEILAPAGCYASLQAAIDAKADAVYFGLAQLNMRARSRRLEYGVISRSTHYSMTTT